MALRRVELLDSMLDADDGLEDEVADAELTLCEVALEMDVAHEVELKAS